MAKFIFKRKKTEVNDSKDNGVIIDETSDFSKLKQVCFERGHKRDFCWLFKTALF